MERLKVFINLLTCVAWGVGLGSIIIVLIVTTATIVRNMLGIEAAAELARVRGEVAATQKVVEDLNNTLDIIKSGSQQIQQDLDSAKKKLESAEKELEKTKMDLKIGEQTIATLNAARKGSSKMFEDILNKNIGQASELNSRQARIDKLEAEVASLKSVIESYKKSDTGMMAQVLDLRARLDKKERTAVDGIRSAARSVGVDVLEAFDKSDRSYQRALKAGFKSVGVQVQ